MIDLHVYHSCSMLALFHNTNTNEHIIIDIEGLSSVYTSSQLVLDAVQSTDVYLQGDLHEI